MKMLKKVNALVLGLAVLLALGCGKDYKQDEPSPENMALKDCLLTKSTDAGGEANEYIYNSAGKVESINYISSSTGQKFRISEQIYNSDGNISEYKFYQWNNVNDQKHIYTYNADKLLASRTFVQLQNNIWTEKKADQYRYNAARQLIKKSYHSSLPDTTTDYYSLYSYPATDQVVEKFYLKDVAGNFKLRFTFHYKYDDKSFYATSLGYSDWNPQLSKHNVISEATIDHFAGTTTTETYAYTYNADGYPVQYFNTTSGQPILHRNYEYTCQ